MKEQWNNGDKVWFKFWSNWSFGTYIGLNINGKTHLIKGDDEFIYPVELKDINQTNPDEFRLVPKELLPELIKCRENPYYFATKYLKIQGKPFTTYLNEDQFNELIKKYETINK